jgi:signal transduction histidine kinase
MLPEALFSFDSVYSARPLEFAAIFAMYIIFSCGAIVRARREIEYLRHKLQTLNRDLIIQKEIKSRETYRFEEMGRISAGLVHDLANPVTAVMIGLDELEAKHGPDSIGQVREGLSYIEECLDSARTNLKDQKRKEFFCARSEVMRVIGFLEPKATEKSVGITVHLAEVELYGENSKFGQVISNLLDNAIDAYDNVECSSGSKVEVCLKLRSDETVVLSVKDNGVGIPADRSRKIFHPFFSTKTNKGTGLGLSIARRIVEDDFGGYLNLSSSPRTGTVFSAELPLPQKLTGSSSSSAS